MKHTGDGKEMSGCCSKKTEEAVSSCSHKGIHSWAKRIWQSARSCSSYKSVCGAGTPARWPFLCCQQAGRSARSTIRRLGVLF